MTSLITADIHMTDNPGESYRWDLFEALAEWAKQYRVDQVIILGDLTDKKDRHRAELVKRMVEGFAEIAEICPVYILRGNHDYVDPNYPFFDFLSELENIHFIGEPTFSRLPIAAKTEPCWFLPSSVNPQEKWSGIDWREPRFIFMHQTVAGAAYENGTNATEGLSLSIFAGCRKDVEIWSGDIHSPQRLGKNPSVEYVGAPYRVDFGDTYAPRVVLRRSDGKQDLRFPCVNKILIDIIGSGETAWQKTRIASGDLVKVRVTLQRHELLAWPSLREAITAWARRGGATLYGPTLILASGVPRASVAMPAKRNNRSPRECLEQFSTREGLPSELRSVGNAILEHSTK